VILNPWGRARFLGNQLARANREIDALERALRDSADRYDRVRDANARLREALELYRKDEAGRG
jgi:septal ring factor EnvC (AmiA/AmiB activator)